MYLDVVEEHASRPSLVERGRHAAKHGVRHGDAARLGRVDTRRVFGKRARDAELRRDLELGKDEVRKVAVPVGVSCEDLT